MPERGNAKDSAVRIAPVLETVRRKELSSFQKAAKVRFRSIELLNLSFIHRSVSNEKSGSLKVNNERLEFLGDSILGACAATLLFDRMSDKNEGDLAKVKSVVVSEESLSGLALELQIDRLLILGKGEESTGGRTKKALLADALEALIGAYYLDSGYDAAYAFVRTLLIPEIERVLENRHHRDYKTLLQEFCQRTFHAYPVYTLIKKSGPDHERLFWMGVEVQGTQYGPGIGKNKKEAEQTAARQAYEALSNSPHS